MTISPTTPSSDFSQYADWTAKDWSDAERTSKDKSKPVEMRIYALSALEARLHFRLSSVKNGLTTIPRKYTDKYPAITALLEN